jgi:hypothetical protein
MRKFKSGNTKLAFGTVLCGADSPDWRYKLLGTKEDSLVNLFYCYWNDGWLATATGIDGRLAGQFDHPHTRP